MKVNVFSVVDGVRMPEAQNVELATCFPDDPQSAADALIHISAGRNFLVGGGAQPLFEIVPAMTRDEALNIVIGIACQWGENAEEGLPQRITADMDDVQLEEMSEFPSDFERLSQIRDLWRAVKILRGQA